MSSAAATELVRALEILDQLSKESAIQLAETRARADKLGSMFQVRLKERIAGVRSEALPSFEEKFDTPAQIRNQHESSFRRETAFLDAFRALFDLYAAEATRPAAEQVFDLLRQIRLNGVGDDPSKFLARLPKYQTPEAAEGIDPKTASLGAFLDFSPSMRDRVGERWAHYDEQIAKSDALLQDALDLARQIP
jgi:hypothetical protein